MNKNDEYPDRRWEDVITLLIWIVTVSVRADVIASHRQQPIGLGRRVKSEKQEKNLVWRRDVETHISNQIKQTVTGNQTWV